MGRDFRKIVAWAKADDLAFEVYKITKKFPKEELYGLTSQLQRAATSVAANIAEGSARRYKKEYLQYLYMAKGSLAEVQYYIHLARRLSYLQEKEFDYLVAMSDEAAKVLQGLIKHISS